MRSIFKYVLNDDGYVSVAADSKLLHVGVDPKTGLLSFWFETPNADQTKMFVRRHFAVAVTGRDQLPLDTASLRLEHVATIVEPSGLVMHVYEKVMMQ